MQCARSAITEWADRRRPAGWALAALLACSCGTQRPSEFAPVCPGFEADIAPVLALRCGGCHGADSDAGWRVDTYLQVLRPSDDDVARVAAGDDRSPLLEAARGTLEGHAPIAATEVALLEKWVVPCRAAPNPTELHPVAWGSPLGIEFHGTALRDAGYNTLACQECHGQDLRGGKSKVDCNGCHREGPFACNTCHGDETSAAPPKALNRSRKTSTVGVGAHRSHVLDSELHLAYGCEKCHPVITNAEDEGHYRFGGLFVSDSPVVVLASFPDAGVAARWDSSSATCSNVACHAPNLLDQAATHMTPTWTQLNGDEDRCGTCHGLGPTGHFSTRCDVCHAAGYADGGVDLALHANGRVNVARGDDCVTCHAGPGTTDFFDTRGDRDAGSVSVGAHTAHLEAGRLRGPLGCPDCHVLPANAFAPGHVDTALPAEVWPAAWPGGLAAADAVTPAFNRAAGTCNAYCHGNGAYLVARDATLGLKRAPVWTGGAAQAQCGACHGLPPRDGHPAHAGVTSVGACAQCHALSVLPDGGIRIVRLGDGGSTSFHIDGVVNGNN